VWQYLRILGERVMLAANNITGISPKANTKKAPTKKAEAKV
jgi:hypothetical protein